jgi:hypothetical protein
MRLFFYSISTLLLSAALGWAQYSTPFSVFKVKANYSLARMGADDLNHDINYVDNMFHQMTQGYYLLNTTNFKNLPNGSLALETNLGKLFNLGVEFTYGAESRDGSFSMAPGGALDNSVSRSEELIFKGALAYATYQIRDRKLPLFLYAGLGVGYGYLNSNGKLRTTDSNNEEQVERTRWKFNSENSGTAPLARAFLGFEYETFGSGFFFWEGGYDYMNFGELDGTTTLSGTAMTVSVDDEGQLQLNPGDELNYHWEGSRPETWDFIQGEFDEEHNIWIPLYDTYTGEYNGDFIDFDLSGFYFKAGLGFRF